MPATRTAPSTLAWIDEKRVRKLDLDENRSDDEGPEPEALADGLEVHRQHGTGASQARSPSELYVNTSTNAAKSGTIRSG